MNSRINIKNEILIHYGSPKYVPHLYSEIKNGLLTNKPFGGLWTSPVNSSFGWKDWCHREHFRECSDHFKLKLKDNAKILRIDGKNDLNDLPVITEKGMLFDFHYIDFEKISKDYDAIWLTEKGERETSFTRPINLYGWDCETVLILNNLKILLI